MADINEPLEKLNNTPIQCMLSINITAFSAHIKDDHRRTTFVCTLCI